MKLSRGVDNGDQSEHDGGMNRYRMTVADVATYVTTELPVQTIVDRHFAPLTRVDVDCSRGHAWIVVGEFVSSISNHNRHDFTRSYAG